MLFLRNKSGQPIEPILTKKTGDDLILFLYPKRPKKLEIRTPKEGLHFEIIHDNDDNAYSVETRHTTGENIGKETGNTVKVPFREASKKVINIKELASEFDEHTENTTSATFALQMINKPQRLTLQSS